MLLEWRIKVNFQKYKYFSLVYENTDPVLEIYIRPLVAFDGYLKKYVIKEQKNRIKSKSNEAIEIECS